MSSDLTYTLQVPRTSLRVTVSESTDASAWEPLDRCAGEPFGVYRSVCIWLSDTETKSIAESYVDAVLAEGDDEIGFQADPDRGDWDGDVAIKAEARYHSLAVYRTVSEVLNRLGAVLHPSAWAAIEQQKKGA